MRMCFVPLCRNQITIIYDLLSIRAREDDGDDGSHFFRSNEYAFVIYNSSTTHVHVFKGRQTHTCTRHTLGAGAGLVAINLVQKSSKSETKDTRPTAERDTLTQEFSKKKKPNKNCTLHIRMENRTKPVSIGAQVICVFARSLCVVVLHNLLILQFFFTCTVNGKRREESQ